MRKKTTIYDIAQELGVTVSTVSRALSGYPAISQATKKAVEEVAKRLNYTPNKLASALKSGKTFIVGVIVPSVEAHFFASIIHSIEEGLKDSGYRIILFQSKELVDNEIKGVKTLLEAQVDGIMASMSLETKEVSHFYEIVNQNKPLILFDRVNREINVPTVTLNDFRAGYIATAHLLKQGYKNIAFITTIHQIKIFSDRLKGYREALKANGTWINEENIIFGGLSIKDGGEAVERLFNSQNTPDAIIAADDHTALGVMIKLKEMGKIPPEIGIMGFANEMFSEYVTPNLSTINQHPAEMGTSCANMFLQMVAQAKPFEGINNIIIEPVVVERQSTDRSAFEFRETR